MDTPVKTTNIPAVSALDEVVGNVTVDGIQRTRRQSVENLARQMLGTAPLRYLSGVAPIFQTEAELLAATITDKVAAWVIDDPNVSKVGIWGWNGTTWEWALPLPYEIVPGVDAGAGTANAIQITTRVPVTDGMLVVFSLFRDTTASPVTLSINGGPALTLATNRGNNASGLTANMDILGIVRSTDSLFRMQSDQDVSALVAQAEAARDEAVAAAASQAAFDTEALASAATIGAGVHAVRLNGSVTLGDGLGGLYIDTDNGATDTFASNGGTRTWYRVADVGSFPSRADFIIALPLDQLRECTANGLRYARYNTGYPAIADAPGWYPLGEPEFEHYGGSTHSDLPPYAEIYHKYDYAARVQLDVIKIKRAKLNTLRALTPPIDDPADGEVTREKLPTLASRHGAMAVTNFMAFRNADGTAGWDNDQLVPNGFLITDGQVVSSWVNGTNLDRTEGFTLQLDGTMKRRTRGVGDAADYVADGAWLGASWGAWIVEDGVNVSSAGSAYFDTGRSARTLIGTNAEGDILLFTFQGSSSSFGPLYSELFALVTAEGATDCYLLEGGGSSQIWWGSYYACPSSDTSYYLERTMPSALGIFCAIQEYDSGYKQIPLASGFTPNAGVGVRFRQVGATVHFEANVNGTFSATSALMTDSEDTTSTTVKNYLWQFGRYLPKDGNGVARGYVAGATGVGGTWYVGAGIYMRKLNSGDTTTYLAGSASWSARHTK